MFIHVVVFISGGGLVTVMSDSLRLDDYSLPGFSFHWGVLPFPSPGDLPDPEIEAESLILQVVSCLAGGFFTDFIPFNCQIIFHCLDGPHFVYPFTSSWVFGLFVLLYYYE